MAFDVKFWLPDKNISWLVNQFETIEFDGSAVVADTFIPRSDAALVFHFGEPPSIIKPVQVKMSLFFIAPVLRTSLTLEIKNQLSSFIVVCKTSVLSRLLSINMTPTPSFSIEPDFQKIYPLWRLLKKTKSTENRIGCFAEFINRLPNTPYINDELDIIYNNILKRSVTIPLAELLQESPINKRSLRRNFIKRVGLSPKTLSRIVRVNYVWNEIKSNNSIDFQRLIFDGGFYDQAHFINDFKLITGESPNHFFKRDLQVVKMISGKEN
jgi:AraC-like DNA-binding protein